MLNFNDEVWSDIPDFIDRYQISNYGRVRSLQNNHGTPHIKIRKTSVRNGQYEYAQLWYKDKPITQAVHRLVASAFIPNPNNKPVVNHIDGNKLNNIASNLEWCTHSENHTHAFATGLKKSPQATLGKKWGGTSQYHNVTWDNSRQKWKATLKNKGKMLFQKRFDSELDAALYVNKMIDELGILDRPKNVIK